MQFIFCVAPRCPRGSLVPYQNEENQFHPVLASLGAGALMPPPPPCSTYSPQKSPSITIWQQYSAGAAVKDPENHKFRISFVSPKHFLCPKTGIRASPDLHNKPLGSQMSARIDNCIIFGPQWCSPNNKVSKNTNIKQFITHGKLTTVLKLYDLC